MFFKRHFKLIFHSMPVRSFDIFITLGTLYFINCFSKKRWPFFIVVLLLQKGRFSSSTLWHFLQKAFFQVGILKGMCQNWAKGSWNGNSRLGPYQFATLITSKNPGFPPNFRGFQCNNYASREHTRFNRKMVGRLYRLQIQSGQDWRFNFCIKCKNIKD